MADDASILHELVHILLGKTRDFFEIELLEDFTETIAFAQNRDPTQAGLKAFECDFFKQAQIIYHRHAPFIVVIVHVISESLAVAAPRASVFAIGVLSERKSHGF